MVSVEVRESEIEDIFAQYPMLLRELLGLSNDLFLVSRQMTLPSGRLDLIYSHLSDLLLIELKVEPFQRQFVKQVLNYKSDLLMLQQGGNFLKGDVNAVLLCPRVTRNDRQFAKSNDVDVVSYNPSEVLTEFFRNAPLDTRYVSVRPSDHGIWRIGLINEALYFAQQYSTVRQIATAKGQSPKTIGNQMRFAEEIGLIQRETRRLKLTSNGKQYVNSRDSLISSNTISRDQASIVRKFILADPFFSGVTFGILTMANTIFELSKNTYPVPMSMVSKHFISAAGLSYNWDTEKSERHGVRMYTNYGVDLGLIAKVGNRYFVTPSGFNFVLLLNMHKSLKLIENTNRID